MAGAVSALQHGVTQANGLCGGLNALKIFEGQLRLDYMRKIVKFKHDQSW